MFRRMTIATRLLLVAGLFLAPFGHGVWVEISSFTGQVHSARLELAGAAYLAGVDGVRASLSRTLIQGTPPDGKGMAAALADLRARHGADMDVDAASREAEALVVGLVAGGANQPGALADARAGLRRLALAINAASGVVSDPEVASFSLGDLFVARAPELREQLVEALRVAADPRPGVRWQVRGRIDAARQAIDDSFATAVGPQGRPELRPALDAARRPLDTLVDRLLPMFDSGAVDAATFRAVLDATDRLVGVANASFVEQVTARVTGMEQERLRIILTSGAMSLLAFAIVVWLVRFSIIAPLRRMSAALLRLADGDITAEAPRTPFNDEIADLSAAMQRFKQQLGASKALSEAVVQSTQQVSVATDQAAAAIAQVSDGAREENASVRRLRQSFGGALTAMKQVETLTADGQERSQAAAAQLAESLADVSAMASSVHDLAGISREINRITLAIGKLAAHSNILSLNASIEASRAGEQGRGFAVVARSVGALAQQTLGLAREITELAQRSNEQIGQGLDAASAVGRRMGEVSASISEIGEKSQFIVDEVARQRGEFSSVEHALDDLLQISQSNAAAAEEISAMMRSLAALTDDTRRQAGRVLIGRANRRRATLLDASIEIAGQTAPAVLFDLSEDGAMLACAAPCQPGDRAVLTLAGEGSRLEAEIYACADDFRHLRFMGDGLPTAVVDTLSQAGVGRLIETTKNDHRAFIRRIADAMEGRTRLAAAEVGSHHACRLGRWYDSVTDEVMLSLPAFADLLEPHRQVHDKGAAVLAAMESGQPDEARRRMAELDDLSRQVIDRLDRLGAEFVRQTAV